MGNKHDCVNAVMGNSAFTHWRTHSITHLHTYVSPYSSTFTPFGVAVITFSPPRARTLNLKV
jgi:hypothetical protein